MMLLTSNVIIAALVVTIGSLIVREVFLHWLQERRRKVRVR